MIVRRGLGAVPAVPVPMANPASCTAGQSYSPNVGCYTPLNPVLQSLGITEWGAGVLMKIGIPVMLGVLVLSIARSR